LPITSQWRDNIMATKILLVDDEKDIVEVTKARLISKGFDVVCAYDGLNALDKVKEAKPDLILLDLFMPVMHGYEVCRKLKQGPETKAIPVILFSAGICKGSCPKEAKDAGASDFVPKPFDVEELVDKINFYTKGR